MTRKIAMNTIRQVVQRLAQGQSYGKIQGEMKVSKGWISKINGTIEANELTHEKFGSSCIVVGEEPLFYPNDSSNNVRKG